MVKTACHVEGGQLGHHGGSSGHLQEGIVGCGGFEGCIEEFAFLTLCTGKLLKGFEAGSDGLIKQSTLEQHRFELCEATYEWIFSMVNLIALPDQQLVQFGDTQRVSTPNPTLFKGQVCILRG